MPSFQGDDSNSNRHEQLLGTSAQDTQQQHSRPQHVETASKAHQSVSEDLVLVDEGDEKGKGAGSVVPWVSLYRGADCWDLAALALGVVGAVVNGLIFPSFSLIFGEVRRHLVSTNPCGCHPWGCPIENLAHA